MMWGWKGASVVGSPGSAGYHIWHLSETGVMGWPGCIGSTSHASDWKNFLVGRPCAEALRTPEVKVV